MKKKDVTVAKEKGQNKKRTAVILAGCGLLAVMGVATTLAYLTDQSEATNNFTFGDVKVKTLEPKWSTEDDDDNGIPDVAEEEVPNQETPKSVVCENYGINDAVVFVKLTVPLETVTRVLDNGTTEKKADGSLDTKLQEIFYYKNEDDRITFHNNNFDVNWVNIPEEEFGYEGAGGSTKYLDLGPTRVYPAEPGYRTYVFGYNRRIAKDEQTTPLFDKVQIKNFIENEVAPAYEINEETVKKIRVETYSIQADNILNENGIIDTTGVIDHDTLKEIYDIYVTQNPQYNR